MTRRSRVLAAALLVCLVGFPGAAQQPVVKSQPARAPALVWRDINPDSSSTHAVQINGASGGRVNGLAAASDKSVFFAASEWGGLYRSTDSGRTWAQLSRHLPMATWQVAVDPTNPRRVYATSFFDGRTKSLAGINVSTDGGATWVHPKVSTPAPGFCDSLSREQNPSAFGIAIDKSNPARVLIGTNCGLAESKDSGVTWNTIYPLAHGEAADVWSVVIHAGIVDICGEAGHSRSTDGGKSWSDAARLPLLSGRCSITASPRDSNRLFATVGGSVFQSRDGGEQWLPLDSAYRRPDNGPGRIASIAANNRSDSTFDLWYGYENLYRGTCTPSRCPLPDTSGVGWHLLGWTNGAHQDIGVVLFDPAAPTDACPIMLSNDGGIELNTVTTSPACHTAPHWIQPNVTPHGLWLLSMDLAEIITRDSIVQLPGDSVGVKKTNDLHNYHRVVFGTQDNGAFQTDRANSTMLWFNTDPADAGDALSGTRLTLNSVCCYPEKRLFLRHIGAGAVLSDTAASRVVPPSNSAALSINGVVAHVQYSQYAALTTAGLLLSQSVGLVKNKSDSVWTSLGWPTIIPKPDTGSSAGLMVSRGSTGPVFYVRIDSAGAPSQLWTLTGVRWPASEVAVNPQTRWRHVTPPNGIGGFGVVTVDRTNPNRLFASHDVPDSTPRMMLSNDAGLTWTYLPSLDACMTGHGKYFYTNARGPTGIGAGKNGFSGYSQPTMVGYGAPTDSGRVMFAGAADAGIFMSIDRGKHWAAITDPDQTSLLGLPHLPRPLFVQAFGGETNSTAYFGTQGRGIWRLFYRNRQLGGAALPSC
ncbi:MAG: hypothetical protein V4550_16040 [Gemmatimonadota bacterium]